MSRYKEPYPELPLFRSSEHRLELSRDALVAGFQVRHLLLDDECHFYIRETEAVGYKSIEWEYEKSYRDCERLVVTSPGLSRLLWSRLIPLLTRGDLVGAKPYGECFYSTDGGRSMKDEQ